MYLIEAPYDKELRILSIEGGERVACKLRQLGLMPGEILKVTRAAPLGGPILIEAQGRMIALGRGIAARIIIEEVECVLP
jgi:ferrous iron transport protein A